MPNRILSDAICSSLTLSQLNDEGAENLFFRLLVQCDDYGRMYADPQILLARCYQRRLELGVGEVERRRDRLVHAGLVNRYAVNGDDYLQVVTWDRYQRVRAKRSRFPAPPPNGCHVLSDGSEPQAIVPPRAESESESNPNPRSTLVDPDRSAIQAAPTDADWADLEPVRKALLALEDAVPDGFRIGDFHDPSYWRQIDALTEGTGVYYLDEFRLYLGWWPTKPPSERHKNLQRGFRRWIQRTLGRDQWRQERSRATKQTASR